MRSPFEIFRKHQKVLTVILTGLAMFAFVILGAVQDPTDMPPALIAIFLACVAGSIGWVAGIRAKKSNEWGLVGLIAGLAMGIFGIFAVGPGDLVRADTGNIDQQQINSMYQLRSIANQFVGMATQRASENGAQLFRQPTTFGFGHPDTEKDLVVGELLRREADKFGLQVSDEAINDFIRSETQDKLGPSDAREIRNQIGVSETDLYEALRRELKALTMARFLYGGVTLPPETYWDFYRQMNVQQSVGIIPVPVEAFVDSSVTPPESELAELFEAHKANFPNFTELGQLDEGLPGFFQPRKVALEYVEIPYEAVEKTIGDITDEEVEKFYEEYYKPAPDLNAEDGAAEGNTPATDDKPEMKVPAADETSPADDKPASEQPETDKPSEGAKPAPESKSETPPAEKPSEDKPAENDKPAEADTPEPPPKESTPEESPEKSEAPAPSAESKEGAAAPSRSELQLVVFFEDEPAADDPEPAEDSPKEDVPAEKPDTPEPATEKLEDKPAPQEPAAEKPADDKPAADQPAKDDKPADQDPDEKKPADETPKSDEPADAPDDAPVGDMPLKAPGTPPKPRELDDELRAEIRDQILRRKTADRQQEMLLKAYEFMATDLAYGATAPEGDTAYVTPEETTKKLKAFAEKNDLVYERTPLLSLRELRQSEEYPVGRAVSAVNVQSTATAADMAFNAGPTELYRPDQVIDIDSDSRFVSWKIEDKAAFKADSLDEPGIREQVVQTWRELKAREQAKARAEELANQAEGVDKPLSEIFAETTVTGKEEGQAISIVHPPRFSWLSQANVSPNPFNRPAPTLTELRTVPGTLGESFMETVVDRIEQGETGVAHSMDMEYYYVVRVEERTYGTSADMQAFREKFTKEPLFAPFGFSDYSKLSNRQMQRYRSNWADELFERHQVDFTGLENSRKKTTTPS